MIFCTENSCLISDFRSGRTNILVATDVAARGLGEYCLFTQDTIGSPVSRGSNLPDCYLIDALSAIRELEESKTCFLTMNCADLN